MNIYIGKDTKIFCITQIFRDKYQSIAKTGGMGNPQKNTPNIILGVSFIGKCEC